jgi:hypothetical protein
MPVAAIASGSAVFVVPLFQTFRGSQVFPRRWDLSHADLPRMP